MNRTSKEVKVVELKEKFAKSGAVILCDFRGSRVHSVTALRQVLSKEQCDYKVYKNTLVKLAIQGTKSEVMSHLLKGQTALIFSGESPSVAAKVVRDFFKEHKGFVIKGGVYEGSPLDAKGVEALANMPGKNELRATLLATLMAPATDLARTLQAASQNFVYLMDARKRQQEE